MCVLITDMHLEFGKHDHVVDSETVPQLGQYIAKDTKKSFAGCRVGRNGEDALGETDEGWQFSASETEFVIEDHRIRGLGLSKNSISTVCILGWNSIPLYSQLLGLYHKQT
jgi:hypothetical protein